MEKVPAILEKYDGSYRITPERPTKKNKGGQSTYQKVKAELFRWEETDAMDIFIVPPRNSANATTKVVKRFDWGGSISRSIYGKYRINLPFDNEHGAPLTLKKLADYSREAQLWILDDRQNFKPVPKPEPKKRKNR
mgnify:CR=1 FL=1